MSATFDRTVRLCKQLYSPAFKHCACTFRVHCCYIVYIPPAAAVHIPIHATLLFHHRVDFEYPAFQFDAMISRTSLKCSAAWTEYITIFAKSCRMCPRVNFYNPLRNSLIPSFPHSLDPRLLCQFQLRRRQVAGSAHEAPGTSPRKRKPHAKRVEKPPYIRNPKHAL